jgi:hypothetical protein
MEMAVELAAAGTLAQVMGLGVGGVVSGGADVVKVVEVV